LASSAAASALSRTLWLQGYPATALAHVDLTIRPAEEADHSVKLLVAMIYAITVLIWNEDLDEADAQIARLIALAKAHSSKSHAVLGRCFQGRLVICRGEMEAGVDLLKGSSRDLQALRYGLLTTEFSISLVQGLAQTDRLAEAVAMVDETIRSVETNEDLCYMPELLRMKAGLHLRMPTSSDEAEIYLAQSLDLSRPQGARAWELRTANCELPGRTMGRQGPTRSGANARAATVAAIHGGARHC
jgi:hypothetical protein